MNYTKDLPLRDILKAALKEDIGRKDITTEKLIPKDKFIRSSIMVKQNCVICGMFVAQEAFHQKDRNIKFMRQVKDGDLVRKGEVIALLSGSAKNILSAERVALNFLSHLSGIATRTREFVQSVKPYKTRIMDTRKTTPGLRILEKYAVRTGGGFNHRFSLGEMILIKDNHLKVIGEVKRLKRLCERYWVEVEAKSLREFKEILRLCPDVIMLDNMSIKDMRQAVKLRNNCCLKSKCRPPKLEASGGITLKTARRIASVGVEMISVGGLTHSVKAVDMSLEVL